VRVPLPVWIFLLQVGFMVGIGAGAWYLWDRILPAEVGAWEDEIETILEEREFGPALNELGRALFVQLESSVEEARERDQQLVSRALGRIVTSIDGVESMVIVDRDRTIQLSSHPGDVGQGYRGSTYGTRFASPDPVRVPVEKNPELTDYFVPIFDYERRVDGGDQTRLGTLIVRYRKDEIFREKLEAVRLPRPDLEEYTLPLAVFLAAGLAVGVLMAVLTGLPARRLEKALADFRARGFKGGFDPKPSKELAPAVEAISEMGGRLEALDAQRQEREALLATLSQSLEEGMIALDPLANPVAWNGAALRILGAPSVREDRSEEEIAKLETWQIDEALKKNPRVAGTAGEGAEIDSREVEVVRLDDRRAPARITRVPFEMRPGEVGTLLLLSDLATLQKVQRHLLEAGRFAVLAHLAAGLAHEIRNPLHSIRINASVVEQYLDTSGPGGDAVAESLETIKGETHRLADLLNNYLGMVRPEKETDYVDVRELCLRVVQLVGYSARKSQVRIRVEGEEAPRPVRGIPDRLQQAILNLVLNAIQAMPGGGELSLGATRVDGYVRVTVSDTGPGIPTELADEVFETGVTTRPGGSGLGLSLVRLIAESHGGRVSYRSVPGKGTSFILDLPASPDR
jgi:signal transduction histidine kinase